jgi:predicted phage terminase large subunit-like protein
MPSGLTPRRPPTAPSPVADGFAYMARLLGAALGDGPPVSPRNELFRPLPDEPQRWLLETLPTYFQNSRGDRVPLARHHEDLWGWFWALRPGVEQDPLIAILARGGGKCLAEGTAITCADGTSVPIQNIQAPQEILSFNEATGRMEPDRIVRHWTQGFQPCLRLRTRTGKGLTLTGAHQVLTFAGWKKASELTLHDRIASPRHLPVAVPDTTHTDEEVRFTAYMIAEGGMTQRACRFTNADACLVGDFITCARSMGFDVVPDKNAYGYRLRCPSPPKGYRKGLLSPIRQWVHRNGLQHLAIHKRVPGWVFRLPPRQTWMFLAVLIDTDGWIEVARGRLKIGLANERLIGDIGTLFLHVGVPSRSSFKANAHHHAWTLQIDQECLAACLAHMPLRLKGAKLQEACTLERYSLLDTYPSSLMQDIPREVRRQLRAQHGYRVALGAYGRLTRAKVRRLLDLYPYARGAWLEQADVFWDDMASIEDVGLYPTYDVEVETHHNLVTNHLITHNSTTTELGAGVVGYYGLRRYGIYLCDTQKQADDHVATVASVFERLGVERAINRYGFSRGWNINRLRTADGFTLDALGLDAAVRGARMDEHRPDLLIMDDLDRQLDTPETIQKKIEMLTQTILPAGASDLAVIGVQNIPNAGGIFAQLADGRAEFLMERTVLGPFPALQAVPETDWYQVETRAEGQRRFRITHGTPVWAGQDLAACEALLNRMGPRGFEIECLHRIGRLAGKVFQREWFPIVTDWPRGCGRVRYWDFAATEVDEGLRRSGKDPDWTVGLLLGMWRGQFWVLDMQRVRLSSHGVEALVQQTAALDGPGVDIWLEEEGGASGKAVTSHYRTHVLAGYAVRTWHSTGSKGERAKPVSSAAEAGNVFVLDAPWNAAFLDEVPRFGLVGVHDDIVDALSGAHYALTLGQTVLPDDFSLAPALAGLTQRGMEARAQVAAGGAPPLAALWGVADRETA